ncbi:MAG: hypothetical protein HY984_00745 [Candidatus Magasanikbacteria bacterium]|nr:hypothetical protein [Candidatus Magasanikbacteria bacterium]
MIKGFEQGGGGMCPICWNNPCTCQKTPVPDKPNKTGELYDGTGETLADQYGEYLKPQLQRIRENKDAAYHPSHDPRAFQRLEQLQNARFDGREIVGDTVLVVEWEQNPNLTVGIGEDQYVFVMPQIYIEKQKTGKPDPLGVAKATGDAEDAPFGIIRFGMFIQDIKRKNDLAAQMFAAAKNLADPSSGAKRSLKEIFVDMHRIIREQETIAEEAEDAGT